MIQEFDKVLAWHCAPALAGIKPGNLISCSKEKFPNFTDILNVYQTNMAYKGFRFEILHECERNYLLFMYRENLLIQYLSQPEIEDILQQYGYPTNTDIASESACINVREMLNHLKNRFNSTDEFPHEIGVFLGYPADDVLAFRNNQGKNYKFCGHWKVYSNVEDAKRQFRQFEKCKLGICRRLAEGSSIMQMFCPGQHCSASAQKCAG